MHRGFLGLILGLALTACGTAAAPKLAPGDSSITGGGDPATKDSVTQMIAAYHKAIVRTITFEFEADQEPL
jgi:hypothetical protein